MKFKEQLKKLLNQDLPGWGAQSKMAPGGKAPAYMAVPDSYKKASVVLLLFEEQQQVKGLFIKRSEHPKDKHSGQISLPGGQLEAGEDYYDAALREVEEELSISRQDFEIIGALSPLYVFVSNFMVQPYVAWMNHLPEMRAQEGEVDQVLQVDINTFTNPQLRKTMDLTVRSFLMKDVPYYDLDGKVLWGATAMMMSEFGEVIG